MTDRRLTCRCAICAKNWPYSKSFLECPICEEDCKPLRLTTPSTMNDHILDWDEACAMLRDLDIIGPCADKPKHAKKKVDAKAAVAELHDDLERWAHEVPSWLRR